MAAIFDSTTPVATYHHRDFSLEQLCALKGAHRISVCIPARNEQATIFDIVATVRRDLIDGPRLVDEVIVIDDRSEDETAALAVTAGAVLVSASESEAVVCVETQVPRVGRAATGKGNAMRTGLAASRGDIVVFLDGDVENFAPHFVTGLLGPVLTRPETMLVKGCYRRPIGDAPTGGGRVNELVARPVMSLLFPELSGVAQPLAGEVALRRDALEGVVLADGYGVELGMLVDISRRYGIGSLAQVDLDVRVHRNRPLHELAPQARDVLAAALARAGVEVA